MYDLVFKARCKRCIIYILVPYISVCIISTHLVKPNNKEHEEDMKRIRPMTLNSVSQVVPPTLAGCDLAASVCSMCIES
jgi:hypothetical protein